MLVKTLQTQMQQHINKNNNKNAQGKLSHPKLIDFQAYIAPVEVYELQAAAVEPPNSSHWFKSLRAFLSSSW